MHSLEHVRDACGEHHQFLLKNEPAQLNYLHSLPLICPIDVVVSMSTESNSCFPHSIIILINDSKTVLVFFNPLLCFLVKLLIASDGC